MTAYLLLVIAIFGVIFWLQASPLIRNRQWKEFAAFSSLLFFALAVTVPQVLGIRLPNPADWLFKLFDPFVKWLLRGVF